MDLLNFHETLDVVQSSQSMLHVLPELRSVRHTSADVKVQLVVTNNLSFSESVKCVLSSSDVI